MTYDIPEGGLLLQHNTGSNYICDPPVTTTDIDIIVLVHILVQIGQGGQEAGNPKTSIPALGIFGLPMAVNNVYLRVAVHTRPEPSSILLDNGVWKSIAETGMLTANPTFYLPLALVGIFIGQVYSVQGIGGS